MKPPDSHFFVSLVYIILLMSLVLHYIQLPHKCKLKQGHLYQDGKV